MAENSNNLNGKYEELRQEGYQLGTLIGKGSVGSVYAGKTPDNRRIAIKIMETTPFLDELVLASIVEGATEAQRVAKYANIVEVYSTGKYESYYFIVMKLFEHGTLEKIVKSTSITIENKLKIAYSLAMTLSQVHDAGIVHGDLKPSNILMDKNNTPFLIDFYHASKLMRKNELRALPQGTPQYMSPEQAQAKFITTASDIYSYGVLFYELLTGQSPYEEKAENVTNMVNIIENCKIVSPRKYNRKISKMLSAVMLKLLEKQLDKRYQGMGIVASDIKACLENGKISIPYEKGFFSFLSWS